jgi:hypothetical protein
MESAPYFSVPSSFVAGAAAEHAAERVLHFRLGGRALAAEEIGGGHEHAGRARAALSGAVALEGGLERGDLAAAREPFDGDDLSAFGLRERSQAGAHLAAVEQHRAGAAVAGVAADLRSGKAEVVAQHVGQARLGRGRGADLLAVDRELDGFGEELRARLVHARLPSSFSVRRTSVSAASSR